MSQVVTALLHLPLPTGGWGGAEAERGFRKHEGDVLGEGKSTTYSGIDFMNDGLGGRAGTGERKKLR